LRVSGQAPGRRGACGGVIETGIINPSWRMPIGKEDIMRSFDMRIMCAAGLLAASLSALPNTALADNMMSACVADIAANCTGVSKGRGRISACLMAHDDKLSAACRTEVANVRNSRAFKRYIPAGVWSLQGSKYEAGLRKACTSDMNRLCSSVKGGDGRILACLYSRSNSVSKACSSQVKMAALGQ
jgi:hypothetical protein